MQAAGLTEHRIPELPCLKTLCSHVVTCKPYSAILENCLPIEEVQATAPGQEAFRLSQRPHTVRGGG